LNRVAEPVDAEYSEEVIVLDAEDRFLL